ncbi:hypothetical protein DL93DRAFT_964688 [Clavulina sp. PMI_390]|nr:hypothetical protein DL93DRAFT_964688 [Clavulina sp. PMI_390]
MAKKKAARLAASAATSGNASRTSSPLPTPITASPGPPVPPKELIADDDGATSPAPLMSLDDIDDDAPLVPTAAVPRALSPPIQEPHSSAPSSSAPMTTSTSTSSKRHRTDSNKLAPPAALSSASRASSAPAPPEWTPAWPVTATSTSTSSTGTALPLSNNYNTNMMYPENDLDILDSPSAGMSSVVRGNRTANRALPAHPHQSHQPSSQHLEPMYAIRSASDVSIDSDGQAVVNQTALNAGEISVPRRLPGGGGWPDAVGGSLGLGLDSPPLDTSEVYGKSTIIPGRGGVGSVGLGATGGALSPTTRRFSPAASTIVSPPQTNMLRPSSPSNTSTTTTTTTSTSSSTVPFGRAQSGVYVHSLLPSASEAEAPSSSDSEEFAARGAAARERDAGRYGHGHVYGHSHGHGYGARQNVEPPGHVASAKPVSSSASISSRSSVTTAFDSMSHRTRKSTPSKTSRGGSFDAGVPSTMPPPAPPPQQYQQHPATSTARGYDVPASSATTPILTALPAGLRPPSDEDPIVWAKWDSLDWRRLLILGYYSGSVQVWDVTDLDSVCEVLHLSNVFAKSGAVPVSAAVLPLPPPLAWKEKDGRRGKGSVDADAFARVRPLLLVLLNTAELYAYSLESHAAVKRVTVIPPSTTNTSIRACSLQVSETFVVVATLSTTHDVALHILSAYDLSYLHTLPLSPSSHLPTFSLSRRLLSVPLPPSPGLGGISSSTPSSRAPILQSGIAVLKDSAASRAGSLQTEVATTARGMWSGLSSVASQAWAGVSGSISNSSSGSVSSSSGSKWPFSSSAPTPSVLGDRPPPHVATGPSPARHGDEYGYRDHHRRMSSQTGTTPGLASLGIPGFLRPSPTGSAADGVEGGADAPLAEAAKPQWIALYDLQPLLDSLSTSTSAAPSTSPPYLVAHFPFNLGGSTSSALPPTSLALSMSLTSSTTTSAALGALSPVPAIACLSLSPSGTLLAAADADGTTIKVFLVRSRGIVSRRNRDSAHRPSSSSGTGRVPSANASPRVPRMPSLSSSPSDPYTTSPRLRRRSSVSSSTGGGRPGSSRGGGGESVGAGGAGLLGAASNAERERKRGVDKEVWHVYDLVRGMTKGRVESIVWSHDERWVGVGTASGTLHIFATNPYGGPPDEDSHLDGRVRNVQQFVCQ